MARRGVGRVGYENRHFAHFGRVALHLPGISAEGDCEMEVLVWGGLRLLAVPLLRALFLSYPLTH